MAEAPLALTETAETAVVVDRIDVRLVRGHRSLVNVTAKLSCKAAWKYVPLS